MQEKKDQRSGKLSGGRYDSVTALMRGEGIPEHVQEKVKLLASETWVVTQLAKLRQAAGITQEEMAKAIGATQPTISKLEAGKDENLTLGQVREYSRVAGQRIALVFGKPMTHVEAVKFHAGMLKTHLEKLAELAGEHDDMQVEIKRFFGEAFFNLFNIMAMCSDKLPPGDDDVEIRVEIIQGKQLPSPSPDTAFARREVVA